MIKKYNNEQINSLEYMILVIFLSRSFYNGIGFQTMLKISKYDTWISLLLGFFSQLFFLMFRTPLFQSFGFFLSLSPSSSLFTATVKKKIRKLLMSLSFSCHFHQKKWEFQCAASSCLATMFSASLSV